MTADPALRQRADVAFSQARRRVFFRRVLGFFTGKTNLVSKESMEKSLESTVKPKLVPLNQQAFECGYQFAIDKEHVT